MGLKYRGRLVGHGKVELRIEPREEMTLLRELWAKEFVWSISILLTSQGQSTEAGARSDIKRKTEEIEDIFSRNNGDLEFLGPDGIESAHVLRNSDCIGGVRIVNAPSYPLGTSVETLTKRTINIALAGLVPVPRSQLRSQLYSAEESLEMLPSGTKTGHLETLTQRAVKQTLRRYQVYRYVQRGTVVGLYEYPKVPRPLFPFALIDKEPSVQKGQPERIGDDHIKWPLSYAWAFESNVPPNSNTPHIWKD